MYFVRLRLSFGLWCLPLLLAPQPCPAQNATNSYWQSQSIYQIITDRFYDGDPSNDNADGNYNPGGTTGTSVHGGDFKGVEQKLDYIKALGATAIWISPVIVNANGEFHGYSGRDFYHVDPHWGSLASLQHMIQTAHARGLLVIDDIVVNHGGSLIYSTDPGYGNFLYPPAGYTIKYNSSTVFAAPFDLYNSIYNSSNNALTNLFHNNGVIQNFNDTNQVVLGYLSGLADFRTESAYVRTQMTAIYQSWIGQAGFDGFRIDTTKHVDMGFWQTWCPAVHAYAATNGFPNFFMFGEVEDGSDTKCGSYTGTMGGGPFKEDSVVDYPLYYTINSVFATASGNTQQIENHYNAIAANYDPSAQMRLVTFLDNHDQPRFLNASGATTNRLEVALAFLYTSRGVPCLYYGTEQGFNGATDPYDREDMFAGLLKDGPPGVDSFNMTHPLFLWVAMLNNFRRLYPALQLGSHVNKWNNPSGPGLFAYARRFQTGLGSTQEVFVVFNTASTTQTLTNRSTAWAAGTQIVNLLNTNEVLAVQSGPLTPQISVPGTTAKVFVAQTDLKPLDPVVTSCSPSHDATNMPINSPIILQFSKPMDTNSVQAAFTTIPAVAGSFSWTPSRTIMTFTPAVAGFPTLTTVVTRVTAGTDTLSSNTLYSPYQLQFHTSATTGDRTPPLVSLLTPTNGAVVSGNLLVSGTASDNVAVQKVEIELDNGPWVLASGTTSWSFNLSSSNFLNGPHQVSARATDTSGNVSAVSTVGVKFFNVPGNYLARLSGGNSNNVTDCSGNVWLTDTAYGFGAFGYSAGGTQGYLNNTITGVCTQVEPLYRFERYSTNPGGFYYEFDCPIGVYQITLLEAETYWSGPGKREFNVLIQGIQVVTNFDIYAAAGGMNISVSLVFTSKVANSQLQVLFTPVIDNARISGLQVRKIADLFSDTDGIPDWWRLAWFGHALGNAADLSRGSDDPDGDGVSNLTEYLFGTNPLDPTSFPVLSPYALGPGEMTSSNFLLSCPTASNWTYQLQSRTGFDPSTSWINLGSPFLATGGPMTLTDPTPSNAARFYRIMAR